MKKKIYSKKELLKEVFTKWTYKGARLSNPVFILWKLLWCPFALISLFVFCVILSLFNLSVDDGIRFWEDTL